MRIMRAGEAGLCEDAVNAAAACEDAANSAYEAALHLGLGREENLDRFAQCAPAGGVQCTWAYTYRLSAAAQR